MRRIVAAALAAIAFVTVPAPALADPQTSPAMEAALAQANRTDDRARDAFRHPSQTLAFFGVEPGMTVVDYMPAGGWYTRILVPYLGKNGRYIGLMPDPSAAQAEGNARYFAALPAKFAEASPKWNLSGAPVSAYVSSELPDALQGTVNRVLIFREMHNLLRSGAMRIELGRIRDLLADDGMLGIVQHRARPWASGDYTDGGKGYLRQSDVIGLVEAHGFALVGTSEINANPKDTADWPGGVWELPPGLSSKNEARKAVGESDRMTLLFRKR
ncbi:hypothetical protein D6858_00260 [Tsuneonella suprasediminis]|uniref:Methyltransferase n=1 Tax=Tsuneonella suprasediminis TaxID=2306996 RepID=A0A419R5Q2_9SPHN|nr:class I SAM-dependent methyltransferase [Tsuneonella suprasediminis]RJX71114.1 hypothetical protein D6858_00260 [Tsuneonella suprasediminis]